MDEELNRKFETAVWIARSLFERNRVTGSTSNISFLHRGHIFISGGGTCFGTLKPEEFAEAGFDGIVYSSRKPSKELPLHRIVYEQNPEWQAVIHTHSFYSTLWSCLEQEDPEDVIPEYTPYLKMKVGRIGLIPYAKPGSEELFSLFAERAGKSDGYLLKNHGPVIAGRSLMDAFAGIEELEESARTAWFLRGENAARL